MVVGLSMLTFGSAATAGVDDVAPILEVLYVDGCDAGGDLDVGCSSRDVVPRGSPWHYFSVVGGSASFVLWMLTVL